MKMHQVEIEFFHVDCRTDMVKLIVAFHNFVNVRKKKCLLWTTAVKIPCSTYFLVFVSLTSKLSSNDKYITP